MGCQSLPSLVGIWCRHTYNSGAAGAPDQMALVIKTTPNSDKVNMKVYHPNNGTESFVVDVRHQSVAGAGAPYWYEGSPAWVPTS